MNTGDIIVYIIIGIFVIGGGVLLYLSNRSNNNDISELKSKDNSSK
jgi:hypothetical protein